MKNKKLLLNIQTKCGDWRWMNLQMQVALKEQETLQETKTNN